MLRLKDGFSSWRCGKARKQPGSSQEAAKGRATAEGRETAGGGASARGGAERAALAEWRQRHRGGRRDGRVAGGQHAGHFRAPHALRRPRRGSFAAASVVTNFQISTLPRRQRAHQVLPIGSMTPNYDHVEILRGNPASRPRPPRLLCPVERNSSPGVERITRTGNFVRKVDCISKFTDR